MILVRLMGGLGNQLFQYAAARYLAHKYNTMVRMDISNYFFDFRTYELNHFCISGKIAHPKEILQYSIFNAFISYIMDYSFFNSSFFKFLFKKGEKIRDGYNSKKGFSNTNNYVKSLINGRYVAERFLHYDYEFELAPNNCYIMGYWQSEKYFSPISNIIKEEFKFKKKIYNETFEKISRLNSVSIHIRRGDKVNANSNYYSTDLEYIYKSVALIKSYVEEPFFFIFSDDLEWVKENIELKDPHYYVNSKHSYEDLQLMSSCKHNIIAESSFSWWAGWLNENPNKIVIAPSEKRWNKLFTDTQDLYPSEWIVLKMP